MKELILVYHHTAQVVDLMTGYVLVCLDLCLCGALTDLPIGERRRLLLLLLQMLGSLLMLECGDLLRAVEELRRERGQPAVSIAPFEWA